CAPTSRSPPRRRCWTGTWTCSSKPPSSRASETPVPRTDRKAFAMMMREGQPAAVHRLDYAPPAYWIDTVQLTFDLDPVKTRVLNKMRLRRNPDVAPQA